MREAEPVQFCFTNTIMKKSVTIVYLPSLPPPPPSSSSSSFLLHVLEFTKHKIKIIFVIHHFKTWGVGTFQRTKSQRRSDDFFYHCVYGCMSCILLVLQACILIVMFMYYYCYVCCVLYIVFIVPTGILRLP